MATELRHHGLPAGRRVRDAVHEHEQRAAATAAVAQPIAVQLYVGQADYAIFIPEIARAITSRWISEVPSKIV